MIPATISTMLSTTSPVTAPPKISAGARVIFGVAALLENTPFELHTLIRSGSLIQLQAATRKASGDHEPMHDLEICRDLGGHRVCRTRRWRESSVELRRQVHVATDEPRKDEFLAKIDKLTARRRIDEAARHRLDPLTFDKNALLRFGLYVWMASLPTAGLPPATWPASAFVGVNPSPHPPPPEGFGASAAAGMTKARCRAMLGSLPI
jgi:hypothetical protein